MANRPQTGQVIRWTAGKRPWPSSRTGRPQEKTMYIGGGAILLIIILFLVFR